MYLSIPAHCYYLRGNPKERDTRLCLRFFQNNLVNPRITCKWNKPPKVCDTQLDHFFVWCMMYVLPLDLSQFFALVCTRISTYSTNFNYVLNQFDTCDLGRVQNEHSGGISSTFWCGRHSRKPSCKYCDGWWDAPVAKAKPVKVTGDGGVGSLIVHYWLGPFTRLQNCPAV